MFASPITSNALNFPCLELRIGYFLGKGGFAVVHDIAKVVIDETTEAGEMIDDEDSQHVAYLPASVQVQCLEKSSKSTTDSSGGTVQDRTFMASNYLRGKKKVCRYALKRVQAFKNPHDFVNGVVDLAVEAKFLAILRHPNIIKMRATANTSPFDTDRPYFLVLDRLSEILSKRLLKWKARKNSLGAKLASCTGRYNYSFWVERIEVGLGIAKALTYMHSKKYVDCSTDNRFHILTVLSFQRCLPGYQAR